MRGEHEFTPLRARFTRDRARQRRNDEPIEGGAKRTTRKRLGRKGRPEFEERAPYTIEEGTMSTKGMSRRNFLALGSLAAVAGGAALAGCAPTKSESKASKDDAKAPHLPVRLPCYDLAPVTSFTLGRSSRLRTSGTPGSHGLTGGVYKARERIHRAMADARLLANPASRSRVADSDPN